MKSLPDVLGQVLGRVARATGSAHPLQLPWAAVAGPVLAAHVQATRFEAGVLRLTCDATAWADAIRADEARLVQRLASAFPSIVGLRPEVS